MHGHPGVARWARLTAGLSLVLHLFLVGVAASVDARLEAAALATADRPDHVEAEGASDCGFRHHDHRYCLVCRSLAAIDAPPAGFVLELPAAPAPSPSRDWTAGPALRAEPGLGARGPPLA